MTAFSHFTNTSPEALEKYYAVHSYLYGSLTEQKYSHPLLARIKEALSGFYRAEEFAFHTWIGIMTGIPIAFYGPGGAGKSDMIKAVLSLFEEEDCLTIPCSSETSLSGLLGGTLLRTEKKEDWEATYTTYNFPKGLMGKSFVALEELGDVSAPVATGLKQILTSGEYLGTKSQNLFIIGASNLGPDELIGMIPPEMSDMTASFQAYISRFLWMYWDNTPLFTLSPEGAYSEMLSGKLLKSPSSTSSAPKITKDQVKAWQNEAKELAGNRAVLSLASSFIARFNQLGAIKAGRVTPRLGFQIQKVFQALATLVKGKDLFLDDLLIYAMHYFPLDKPDFLCEKTDLHLKRLLDPNVMEAHLANTLSKLSGKNFEQFSDLELLYWTSHLDGVLKTHTIVMDMAEVDPSNHPKSLSETTKALTTVYDQLVGQAVNRAEDPNYSIIP